MKKMKYTTTLTIFLILNTVQGLVVADKRENPCAEIEKAFTELDSEKPVCQCMINNPIDGAQQPTANATTAESTAKRFWIGCTRQKMPAVFRALFSLNDTKIEHLHVWDSLINILPKEMNEIFAKIRPEKVTIETSRLGVIRKEAFSNVGSSLKELSLKNNILRSIEEKTFDGLSSLVSLDLSGNKLTELKPSTLRNLTNLETLMLSNNPLNSLQDGIFQTLGNLRILNLANVSLKRITRDTFKGLDKLEVLILRENKIESVDKDAFSNLKALRMLDLWDNKIEKVAVQGNHKLERLILGNNSIFNMSSVTLGGLSSLVSLHLEGNKLSTLADDDMDGLRESTQLVSLLLDRNNISWIGCRAFEAVPHLVVLSLQHNKIASLSCSSANDPSASMVYLDRSVLEPLASIKLLLLSSNDISTINDEDLAELATLRYLAMDHNKISRIGRNSFNQLKIKKLFLNHNHLYYLPEGIFDDLTPTLQAIDLSSNNWECICGQEWLGHWLKQLKSSVNAHSGTLGCLVGTYCEQAQGSETMDAEGHEVWIRMAACVLALVAILFLLIAGYVYVQESRYSLPSIRRFSSDTIRLIPSQENLFSFPNPIMEAAKPTSATTTTTIPPLSILSTMGKVTAVEGEEGKRDRKKVRFNQ